GDPQAALRDTIIFDSGCSRHMTGNKFFLLDYQEYDGGFVGFAGSCKGGKITVKRIFRYLKGHPTLGFWYPKDSPLELIAYSDSDYTGASLDRKSTTGGCQFLGSRLISWQCKKQTIVANSTTEAEYITASSCYGQVL
nr:putative ribonuclease H-like domain-containing protein [Tanacetum cinerariifolium]